MYTHNIETCISCIYYLLVRARTCKKRNFQTASQKQALRPVLRSRVPGRVLPGSSHIAFTVIRNLVLMANYSISVNVFCLFAISSQGKTQREEKRKKKKRMYKKKIIIKLSNNYTVRSFALVNDDWIGALCLSINAHKKSRNY